MTLFEAMAARHSVRQYKDLPLEESVVDALQEKLREVNAAGSVNFVLVTNEPTAFASRLARYGSFRGVSNYILLSAGKGMEEAVGYYGEQVVLYAQTLGLNTCWVGLTYSKKIASTALPEGSRLYLVLALGYGETNGHAHKSKPAAKLTNYLGAPVYWFDRAMEAAMLAPTAVNQQKFLICWDSDELTAKALPGPYSRVDLGIVKYHFELGAAEAGHPIVWSE